MDAVEAVKSKLDVDEVLASYMQLKPAGANLKGVCPFHQEKTPSLMVSPEKGIWHCFGCGEGGDIFTFVMKMEGLEFKEALQKLASQAGVDLPERGSPRQAAEKEALLKVAEFATKYYQAMLAKSPSAKAYLKKRGFSEQTIKDFRLGFAPASGAGVAAELKKRGAKEADIVRAGLAKKAGAKLNDLFRARLMVPLADAQGRPIGFTGRVLDNSLPKYLNTPATALFDKSRFLFGLHLAREQIRQMDEAVIVEGNLDVVSSHQAGVANVVASSGTALTSWQLKSLSRLTRNIKLAFDQDAAGIAATERSIPLAQQAGVSLYIVSLGGAKDPDELIQKDPKLWQASINKAVYVMDWLLAVAAKRYDLASVPGKKNFSDHILRVLAKLPDPVEQDHYANKLAKLIDVSPQSILSKLAASQEPEPAKPAAARPVPKAEAAPRNEGASVEEALLAVAVTYPDTRVSLQDISAEHFSTAAAQAIYSYLVNNQAVDLDKKLPKELQEHENYVKILLLQGEEQFRSWAALDRRIEAFGLAGRLQTLFIKRTQKRLQNELKAAEAAHDDPRRQQILREFRDLSRKL